MIDGGIQLLTPIYLDTSIIYGERVLPIIPIMLVQPKPKLLTLVGNSSAT